MQPLIEPLIDIDASVARIDSQTAAVPGMAKLPEDLDRYAAVIAVDQPEVIVECGTWQGGSARWFAAQGVDVITIDIAPSPNTSGDRITWICGDSVLPELVGMVKGLVAGRRTMVVLDSNHSAKHVAAEIAAYGPMVSDGCHLVVEDGIIRWIPSDHPAGRAAGDTPMEAIEKLLVDNDNWERDTAIEEMYPVSMFPAGWWIRHAS
jgi:cephalosporin hydroxylase